MHGPPAALSPSGRIAANKAPAFGMRSSYEVVNMQIGAGDGKGGDGGGGGGDGTRACTYLHVIGRSGEGGNVGP